MDHIPLFRAEGQCFGSFEAPGTSEDLWESSSLAILNYYIRHQCLKPSGLAAALEPFPEVPVTDPFRNDVSTTIQFMASQP